MRAWGWGLRGQVIPKGYVGGGKCGIGLGGSGLGEIHLRVQGSGLEIGDCKFK